MVFADTFAVVFLFLYFNLRIARGDVPSGRSIVLGTGVDGRPIAVEGRQPRRPRAAGRRSSSRCGSGLTRRSELADVAELLQRRAVRRPDPLFGRDVAFYVFKLPVSSRAAAGAGRLVRSRSSAAALYYVLSGSFVIEPRPRRGVLAALPADAVGAAAPRRCWPRCLRAAGVGRVAGIARHAADAGAANVVVRRVVRRRPRAHAVPLGDASSCWSLGAALAVCHGFSRARLAAAAGRSRSTSSISVAGGVYAAFVQRFVVTPNEQDKEQPYIVHNIAATRARLRARPRRGARSLRRRGAHGRRTSSPTPRRLRTSGSGITSRCCRRSRRFRKSARTTTSRTSTTTATRSTASTGR